MSQGVKSQVQAQSEKPVVLRRSDGQNPKPGSHRAETFGKRLRWLRDHFDQSLEFFGREIGYDKSYLSRLESGATRNPSSEFLDAVCKRFLVSRDWLEHGEGEPFPPKMLEAGIEAIDWEKLRKSMSLAAKYFQSISADISLDEFLRCLIRGMSAKEKLARLKTVADNPNIDAGAKTLWVTSLMFAISRETLSEVEEKSSKQTQS